MLIERSLSTDGGDEVILYFKGPEKSESRDEYFCEIRLIGSGIDAQETIYGIDQFQSVILSIRHLDYFVSKISKSISPRYLKWELGSGMGDFGLKID